MNIAILGGTKFFGRILTDHLLKAGHELTIYSRVKTLPTELEGKVRHVQVDIAQQSEELPEARPTRLRPFFEGIPPHDIVIDNISMFTGDVAAITSVLNTSKLQQFVLCSSALAYDPWNLGFTSLEEYREHLLKEDDINLNAIGFRPQFPSMFNGFLDLYATGKRQCELELMSAARESGFNYTIMRPAVIEGPGDFHWRTWYWAQRLLDHKPILVPPSTPMSIYRHVFAPDVADAFFRVIGNPVCYNQAYNVCGDEILTVNEYLSKMAELLGFEKPQTIPMPSHDISESKLEFPVCFSGFAVLQDNSKLKRDTGFIPTPFYAWMNETLSWLLSENSAGRAPASLGYEQREIESKQAILFLKEESKKDIGFAPSPR